MPTQTINCIVCKKDILGNLRKGIHSCKTVDTTKTEWAESTIKFECQGRSCGYLGTLADFNCDNDNYAYCPDCSSYKLIQMPT
jgi:hypothetical protein